LRRACELFALGGAIAAVYGLYVWIVLASGMRLPLLPGTWAFAHLHRTAGTFPEPVAFSGFLLATIVITLLLTEWRLGERRRWAVLLGLQVSALLASLSTLGLLGLIALLATMLVQWRSRAAVRMFAVAAITVVLLSFTMSTRVLYVQLVQKVFSAHSSWTDRVGAWEAAAGMFAAYPVLGVGAGLYAYNQADFFPVDLGHEHAGGRVNSILLESLAEYGLAGTVPLVLIFVSVLLAVHTVRRRGSSLPDFRAAGYSGIAIILILVAGYYTSRYMFLWVFAALLIAAGTSARHEIAAS
jgi:O-antigen ligase